MSAVIAKVRNLVRDPAGVDQYFGDDEIEQACDMLRRDVFRLELRPAYEVSSTGDPRYVVWFSPDGGWWESDATVQDSSHQTLTATTAPALTASDYVVGRWTLGTSYDGQLYLSGKQHDVYGAAADLLEAWSAEFKEDFDFLSAGRTFKRSQKQGMYDALIAKYRARQWVRTSEMVRTDMNPLAPDRSLWW